MDAERLVHDVADRVRALLEEAERHAARIVGEAEADAQRIRERAESEAQEQVAAIRRALDELQGKLSAPGAPPPEAEVEPGPVVVPEPEPPGVPEPGPEPVPEPYPEPTPEPEPAVIPEPAPPPDEGTPPQAVDASPQPADAEARSDDAVGARLVAMNMALEGASREQIEGHLAEHYALEDAGGLVDGVLALAAK